jgi:hypothetical protein
MNFGNSDIREFGCSGYPEHQKKHSVENEVVNYLKLTATPSIDFIHIYFFLLADRLSLTLKQLFIGF